MLCFINHVLTPSFTYLKVGLISSLTKRPIYTAWHTSDDFNKALMSNELKFYNKFNHPYHQHIQSLGNNKHQRRAASFGLSVLYLRKTRIQTLSVHYQEKINQVWIANIQKWITKERNNKYRNKTMISESNMNILKPRGTNIMEALQKR